MYKKVKYLVLFVLFTGLFTFNIWLINQGSGFTVPRELLFRTYSPIWRPIVVFLCLLLVIFLLHKPLKKRLDQLSQKKKTILTFLFAVCYSFSLFFTVQTNPDFGTYFKETQYFIRTGLIRTLTDWGRFSCTHTLPVMPIIYGAAMKVVSNHKLAVLSVNILIYLGILIFLYFLTKKLLNKKQALISLLFFATSPFVVSQTNLMLVDLGLTFFLSACFYFSWLIIKKANLLKTLSLVIVLILASLTKVFAGLYLVVFSLTFLVYGLATKKYKQLRYLLSGYLIAGLIDLGYLLWKRDIYFPIFNIDQVKLSFLVIALVSIFLLILLKTVIPMLKNKFKINKRYLYLLYLPLAIWFLIGGRYAFYLRTIPIGTNLIIGILFFLSYYFVIKKEKFNLLLLYPWILTVNLVPTTVFKHQLPTYPAIIILSVFSFVNLTKWLKNKLKVNKGLYLLTIIAFSSSILYFFFLPMINKHVKNNIRKTAIYLNKENINKTAVTFFPIGIWGERFESALLRKTKCPQPPSAVDMLTFFANSQVDFEYHSKEKIEDQLINSKELYPAIIVITHMDVPTPGIEEFNKLLKNKYIKNKVFDQAKGSGIWRVRLTVYTLK